MWILLLIPASAFYTQYDVPSNTLSCPSYRCDTTGKMMQNDCIYFADDVYNLKPCESSIFSYCPPIDKPGNSTCTTLSPSTYQTSWPGESCVSDRECRYGACKSGICRGAIVTEECSVNTDCDAGLVCYKGTCKGQKGEGEECLTDDDCSNDTACFIVADPGYQDKGVCTKLFGKQTGQQVLICNNYTSLFCESTMCYNNMCIDYIHSEMKTPQKCTQALDCSSTDYFNAPSFIAFYTDCQCGYSSTGTAYCNLFPGDSSYKHFLMKWKEWTESDEIHECHFTRKFEDKCIKEKWNEDDYYELVYYKNLSTNLALYQDNDSCVIDIYTKEFYEDQDELDSDLAGMLLASGLILIGL